MKKLSLILLFTCSFLMLKAQSTNTWNNFNGKVYGTEQEYKNQISLREKAGYELYRLLGFKSYFSNGLPAYLQQTKGFTVKVTESKKCLTYTLTPKEEKNPKFVLKFWTDSEDRITKAKIIGNKEQLAYIFSNYWPAHETETIEGSVAEKKFLSETIVFNYSGKQPYIEVVN